MASQRIDMSQIVKSTSVSIVPVEKTETDVSHIPYLNYLNLFRPKILGQKNALKVIGEYDRLFILGKPGAGKSTLLRWIALKAVEGKFPKVPVLIGIKKWSDSGLELLDFITQEFDICGFPEAKSFVEHVLDLGQIAVLLDGLDEVNQESQQRESITAKIRNFTRKYHKNKFLITCRNAATEYTFDKFFYVEIADFEHNQIRKFISNWFKSKKGQFEQFTAEFYKPKHNGLRELAKTPLLLALMCLAFEEGQSFPERLVDIYDESIDALLRKWDETRHITRDTIYQGLSTIRKQQMFAEIAAKSFEDKQQFFRQDDLSSRLRSFIEKLPSRNPKEDIDGMAILRAIVAQHGIFAEQAHWIYSFSHSTFQEYFTAKYIVDHVSDGSLQSLIEHRITDDRWTEVMLMTASLLSNADSFFDILGTAINNLIFHDQKITQIINWANEKAIRRYGFDYASYNHRACAIALALNLEYSRAIALARANTHNPHRFLFLAVSIDASRKIFDEIANKEISHFNDTYRIFPNSDLDNDIADAIKSINNDESRKYYDYFLKGALQKARDISSNISESFQIPSRDTDFYWGLTLDQAEIFYSYSKANHLFLRCLNLAIVTNRNKTKNNLFQL